MKPNHCLPRKTNKKQAMDLPWIWHPLNTKRNAILMKCMPAAG